MKYLAAPIAALMIVVLAGAASAAPQQSNNDFARKFFDQLQLNGH